jgi:hypothetical protein
MKKTLYICGPMTGLPDLNRPAFARAQLALERASYTVLSPLQNGLPPSAEYEAHMRADLALVRQAGGIAVLPGCNKSPGAARELALARGLGLHIAPVCAWVEGLA